VDEIKRIGFLGGLFLGRWHKSQRYVYLILICHPNAVWFFERDRDLLLVAGGKKQLPRPQKNASEG
jgi:hypothetical protein